MCTDTTDGIITENLCGYINLKDSCFHTIWRGIGLKASITIKVKNTSNNIIKLKIKNKKCIIIRIAPNDEKIITVRNVNCISVQCNKKEDEEACCGSFQLIIHYPVDFKDCNKHSEDVCNINIKCGEDVKNYTRRYPL